MVAAGLRRTDVKAPLRMSPSASGRSGIPPGCGPGAFHPPGPSLGAGRGAVLGLFLAEALLLGVAGAALGVAFGRLLAGVTVRTISDTVNALYTTSRPTPVELTWSEAWMGLLT